MNTEFDTLDGKTDAEKKKILYENQKALLLTFLEHGAITKAQYDKSLGDLTVKMGFKERKNDI